MIVSGLLSLAGLIGGPLADMNVRNIGIIGYAGVFIVVFLLWGWFSDVPAGYRENRGRVKVSHQKATMRPEPFCLWQCQK